jgi:regulator of replication initiation timing
MDVNRRDHDILMARMFSSQRNAYLTGFTLFFMMIINRFQSMINEMLLLEEKANLAEVKHPDISQLMNQNQILKLKKESLKRQVDELENRLLEMSQKLEASKTEAVPGSPVVVPKQTEETTVTPA